MEQDVYVKAVLPEIYVFFGIALVVLFGFLFYEVRWYLQQRKAPKKEQKNSRTRIFYCFAFVFVWSFALLAYTGARSETFDWGTIIVAGSICLSGALICLLMSRL